MREEPAAFERDEGVESGDNHLRSCCQADFVEVIHDAEFSNTIGVGVQSLPLLGGSYVTTLGALHARQRQTS